MRTPNDERRSKHLVRTASGGQLAVHDLGGSGRDVLFVHATGFHGRVWEPVAELLAERIHGWAVDLGGHGDSSAPETITWAGFGQEVLAAADALPRPLTAIGHSLGGAAVTLAEIARPGTFDRLIMFEPALPDEQAKANLPVFLRTTERRRPSFDSFDAAVENFASKLPTSEMADAALRAYVAHGFRNEPDGSVTLKCAPAVEARIYACPDAFETHLRLHPLDCPVTLIAGALSDYRHRRSVEHAADRFAAPIVEMAGAGHFGPLQVPEAFAQLVRSILDEP